MSLLMSQKHIIMTINYGSMVGPFHIILTLFRKEELYKFIDEIDFHKTNVLFEKGK